MQGSGKTHLTKLFILNALKEVRDNPYAKLIVYEPKREFYAWLSSLGLNVPIHYFLPSDVRSVPLDFMRDYPSDQDSKTLAHAFYPAQQQEHQRFWSDSLRTIYAQTCDAIKRRLGRFDLRLMCLVLEDEELTRKVLEHDPYLVQARVLTDPGRGYANETGKNIQMTIHSRIAEMKVLAAHLERARCEHAGAAFSLRDFIEKPRMGVLSVSRDSTFRLVQDPMNGVLFWRLIQLLDAEQYDRRRKVFMVLDEFPVLAGDEPCPGVHDLFTRLRNRGVTVLITYQAHATLKRIYGEATANIVGLCQSVIYTRQGDVESTEYASKDLGYEWKKAPPSITHNPQGGASISQQSQYLPIFEPTELRELLPARPEHGLFGVAMSAEVLCDEPRRRKRPGDPSDHQRSRKPWRFKYAAEQIHKIPKQRDDIPEYVKRDPQFQNDADVPAYFEEIKKTQRLEPLSDAERRALLGEASRRQATLEDILG